MTQPVPSYSTSPSPSSSLSPHSASQFGWVSTYQKWLQLRAGLPSKLWTTFAVVMSAFFIARVPYIFPNGLEIHQLPSEYYHFRIPLNKAFLWTHLACVLPAGLLAVTQFVPRIRARAMDFHRNAGKVINVLTFISTIAAWGITRVSFGGDPAIQSVSYMLGIITLWSTTKSWAAIRRLQIDEHRIWAVRAWSHQMSIVTMRILMVPAFILVSAVGGFYQSIPCAEVEYVLGNKDVYTRDYPQCQTGWSGPVVTHVAIEGKINSSNGMGDVAALQLVFGTSLWIALFIHMIGTEYYLYKTRDESNRLQAISTRRQDVRRKLKSQEPSQQ